jgi:hypothetical protein
MLTKAITWIRDKRYVAVLAGVATVLTTVEVALDGLSEASQDLTGTETIGQVVVALAPVVAGFIAQRRVWSKASIDAERTEGGEIVGELLDDIREARARLEH